VFAKFTSGNNPIIVLNLGNEVHDAVILATTDSKLCQCSNLLRFGERDWWVFGVQEEGERESVGYHCRGRGGMSKGSRCETGHSLE